MLSIRIRQDDKFSKTICCDCLDVLINAFKLKENGIESEKYLAELDDIQVEPKKKNRTEDREHVKELNKLEKIIWNLIYTNFVFEKLANIQPEVVSR